MKILIHFQLNSAEDGSEFTDLSISQPDFLLHPDPGPGFYNKKCRVGKRSTDQYPHNFDVPDPRPDPNPNKIKIRIWIRIK
jgi:hypothetical protein